MNQYYIKTYSSVSEISSSFWAIFNSEKSPYFSKAFLEAFELSNPKIEFKYCVLYDSSNEPKGMALLQIINLELEAIFKNVKVHSLLNWLVKTLVPSGYLKMLVCGNIFLSGEHGLKLHNSLEKEQAFSVIVDAIEALKDQIYPLHGILVKDFYTPELFTTQFIKYGFSRLQVEPNMIIKLQDSWHSFEDYKEALKSKYRVKVNKADSKSAQLHCKLLDESEFKLYKNQLQSLYENTIKNANFNAQVLNLNTYLRLRKAFKKDFTVTAYFLADQLVGFATALVNDKHLDAHFIGLNYDLNKTHSIYPRILNDYIRLGIKKRLKQINFGRTASEIKSTVGADPHEICCYIKHKKPWVNIFIRLLIKRIKLKEFRNHSPFKTDSSY